MIRPPPPFYDQSIMDTILHVNCIKNEIETVMEAKAFILYYQPKYAIDGVMMLGLEALIRWKHKDGSIKSPGYFIDLAEQSGQIINIGFYVIERICQSIVEYHRVEKEMPVAINLSGQHFTSRDILYKLLDAVKSCRLLKTMIQMAHELSFEVTVEGIETLEQFESIKGFEPKEFQGFYFKCPAPLNEIFDWE